MGEISMQVQQSAGLEDEGNCWKQRILNFNLRPPISSELVIYLGALATKLSLTTGHEYIHKHSAPASFTVPFCSYLQSKLSGKYCMSYNKSKI